MIKSISKKQNKTLNLSQVLLSFFIVFLLFALIQNPHNYIKITLEGILLWATVVLPALLPFFVLTQTLISIELVESVFNSLGKIFKILFRAPAISSYVFIVSILSGYPVGAKLTADCYTSGLITQKQAQKMSSFTSTSGPMFVVGTVGVGMLFSQRAGFVILICHIIGSLLNGLLYRNSFLDKLKEEKPSKKEPLSINEVFLTSVQNSSINLLVVGGFISLFFVFIQILKDYRILEFIYTALSFIFLPLGINKQIGVASLEGLVEITRGAKSIALLGINLNLATLICTFLISFGGLSTYFQSLKFLSICKINKKIFLLQKTTQALLSTAVCAIFVYLFKIL